MNQVDPTKTLEQLENQFWGDPPEGSSSLIQICHNLRRKPLSQFSPENLRIMISQQIGLEYLVPMALEILEINPMAEGDHYPGDLISVVYRIDKAFWNAHPDWHNKIVKMSRGTRIEYYLLVDPVHDILFHEWDPIGCGVPEDEYDSYIPGVIKLLMANADEQTIADHLYSLETKTMGVNGIRSIDLKVARRLISLRETSQGQ